MSSTSINLSLSTQSSGSSATLGPPSTGGKQYISSFSKSTFRVGSKSLILLATVAAFQGSPNPRSGVQLSARVRITLACAYILCWFSGEYFPIQSSQELGLCPIPSICPVWIVTEVAEKLATCSLGSFFRIRESGGA